MATSASAAADAADEERRGAGPEQPWSVEAEAVLDELSVERGHGLDAGEVEQRRERHGRNALQAASSRSAWAVLVDQLKSVIVVLLIIAGGIALLLGRFVESAVILVVIAINTAIGFVSEWRAVRSMEALRQLSTVDAMVRREGEVERLPADELVPGDIVVLESGAIVTADLRLVEASRLEVDESALTGESVPVAKQVEPAPSEAPLAERASMLYKGTAVTRGAGEGVVVATGTETELGHISSLVSEAEAPSTPLEQRLDRLGRRLVWLTLVVAALVAVAGIVSGRDALIVVETSIALAVAAVPEGLPIVATLALARGMWRMARRNALVKQLSAVETLGSTSVVLSDKTGTLTENRMTVVRLVLPERDIAVDGQDGGAFASDGEVRDPHSEDGLWRALRVGVLCNDASLDRDDEDGGDGEASADGDERDESAGEDADRGVGDPMEVALLVAGGKAELRRPDVLEELPEEREEAFDPDVRMMATVHRSDGRFLFAVKGAPEPVLDASSAIRDADGTRDLTAEDRERWLDRNEQLADEGLRILALAEKDGDDASAEPYADLTFLGLVGFRDPPREDVRGVIERCQAAGIRMIMVTGDHPGTARHVAGAVGLAESDGEPVLGDALAGEREGDEETQARMREATVFARVEPEQKLDLISLHQSGGAIVAMLGDGVNDAPALKQADIGVAMGKRGTQVAKEAAAMVLQDDQLGTILSAIEQGRVIFRNIRQFVVYLLSCNMSQILIVGLAAISGAPLPLLPLQILFLNVVTDVFPALALGVGRETPQIMDRPPRPREERILERPQWLRISGYAGLITASVLTAFAAALLVLDLDAAEAVTVSFLTTGFVQLWHVFNMAEPGSGVLRNEVSANPWVWGALLLCTGLLLGAAFLPIVSDVLGVVDPGPAGWGLIVGLSLAPLVLGRAFAALVAVFRSAREGSSDA